MNNKVILLLLKTLLASLPFAALTTMYLAEDPFKVIYSYSTYFQPNQPQLITLNKDFVSTETFIKYYPYYKYDSFIFGSSRSMFYDVNEWQKHIKSDKIFHFDASGESLYGINKKIKFLFSKKVKLRNIIIVLDNDVLSQTNNSKGQLFIKHPVYSNQSIFSFQLEFFKSFFNPIFLFSFIDFKVSHTIKPYMKKEGIFDDMIIDYNLKNNQVSLKKQEEMIIKNKNEYYSSMATVFYDRDSIQQYNSAVIHPPQVALLKEIINIMKSENSNYRIIISPLYDQKRTNPADSLILRTLFGKNNIFDFSGINPITENKYNYYENSHYRPFVASQIMNEIYEKESKH